MFRQWVEPFRGNSRWPCRQYCWFLLGILLFLQDFLSVCRWACECPCGEHSFRRPHREEAVLVVSQTKEGHATAVCIRTENEIKQAFPVLVHLRCLFSSTSPWTRLSSNRCTAPTMFSTIKKRLSEIPHASNVLNISKKKATKQITTPCTCLKLLKCTRKPRNESSEK